MRHRAIHHTARFSEPLHTVSTARHCGRSPSLRAKRSNPEFSAPNVDCFVPRNDGASSNLESSCNSITCRVVLGMFAFFQVIFSTKYQF